MLDYSKFDNSIGFFNLEEREEARNKYILEEINKRQQKLKNKEDEIDNLQYERNLVLNDLLSVIRTDISHSGLNLFRYLDEGDLFYESWRYANNHKNKDFEPYKDNAVKKKEKQSYGFVTSQIERLILNGNTEFKRVDSVMDYYYSLYYEYTYEIRGHEIYICIPNFHRADDKNYQELLSGYVIRYKESDYCIGWICSDIDYTKIYDKLMAWINDHWSKIEEEKIDE